MKRFNPYESQTDAVDARAAAEAPPPPSVAKAVAIGYVTIVIPVVLIGLGMAYPLMIHLHWPPLETFLAVLGPSWLYWSLTVPIWRDWAEDRGVDPDRLQRVAALTGLVWPKGWIFEKTEIRLRKRRRADDPQ